MLEFEWMLFLGLVLLLQLGVAAFVYTNAPKHSMHAQKWALIAFLIPFFGVFAYLFEKEERYRDPDEDFQTAGPFEIHPSRADEVGIEPGGTDPDDESGT